MTDVATTLHSAYLAGPMRGHDDFNFPEFHKQAAWLRGLGWKVFSPAERDEADESLNGDWKVGNKHGLDYFMQFDLAAVCQTDAVILMSGWEDSQGARLEAVVAVEIGHPVFVIDPCGGARSLRSVDPEYVRDVFYAQGQGVVGENAADRSRPVEQEEERVQVAGIAIDREHVLSEDCWCNPKVEYVEPVDMADYVTIPEEETIPPGAMGDPSPGDPYGPSVFGPVTIPEEEHISSGVGEPRAPGVIYIMDEEHTILEEAMQAVADLVDRWKVEVELSSTVSTDPVIRKASPIATGVLDYFPAALLEVSRVSKAGNDKHNPGEPLHHARGKSTDHADALLRHLIDRGKIDAETGQRHSAEVAWRALAMLQQELEDDGAPLARGAVLPEGSNE